VHVSPPKVTNIGWSCKQMHPTSSVTVFFVNQELIDDMGCTKHNCLVVRGVKREHELIIRIILTDLTAPSFRACRGSEPAGRESLG
jgi:hypothetical protein